MNAFEQLAVGWQVLVRTLARLGRPAVWAPFTPLALLEFGALVVLIGFAHPLVSWIMAPLLRRAGGEALLHYPNVLRQLPDLYGRVDLLLGATVGAVVVGAGTRVFADQFAGRRDRPGAALREATRRAPALILVSAPFNLLAYLLSSGLGWLIAHRQSGALVHRFADLIVLGGTVVLQSLFFYVACDVMLAGRGVIGTLANVPHAAARGFWAALLVGALLALPLLPLQSLAGHSALIVERGTPELVGWLMAAEAAIGLVLWFALAGSATLAYLTLVDHDPESSRT